jgi:hypothetical protein
MRERAVLRPDPIAAGYFGFSDTSLVSPREANLVSPREAKAHSVSMETEGASASLRCRIFESENRFPLFLKMH